MTDQLSEYIRRHVDKAMAQPDGAAIKRYIDREVPADIRARVHAEVMKRVRVKR